MLQSSQKYHLVVEHIVEHLVMILKKHTTDYKPMEKVKLSISQYYSSMFWVKHNQWKK